MLVTPGAAITSKMKDQLVFITVHVCIRGQKTGTRSCDFVAQQQGKQLFPPAFFLL